MLWLNFCHFSSVNRQAIQIIATHFYVVQSWGMAVVLPLLVNVLFNDPAGVRMTHKV